MNILFKTTVPWQQPKDFHGNQLGTRANANQVDLNRAFPTQNWDKDGTVYRWSSNTPVRDVKVKTGQANKLEPEVQSLIDLIEQRKPKFVISFHEPLAMVDDPVQSELASWLGKQFKLPIVEDVDYETPGSFGTWCEERNLPCITVELPPISSDFTIEEYLDAFLAVLGVGVWRRNLASSLETSVRQRFPQDEHFMDDSRYGKSLALCPEAIIQITQTLASKYKPYIVLQGCDCYACVTS